MQFGRCSNLLRSLIRRAFTRQWLQFEILDVGGFGYAPSYKKPDNAHAGKRLLQCCRSGAEMRARRQHVIEQSDHSWIGVLERMVDRVVRLDLLRRGTILLIMHGRGAGALDDEFAHIERGLSANAPQIRTSRSS